LSILKAEIAEIAERNEFFFWKNILSIPKAQIAERNTCSRCVPEKRVESTKRETQKQTGLFSFVLYFPS